MAGKAIKLDLDLNSKEAQKAVKDFNKELGNAEDALDDVESAGKQMARAISMAADDMIDEIDATKRAVDALERNMGDLDADPREVVADLKRIGLTAQDIEQDAEELAAALRKSGDVKVHAAQNGFKDLGQAVDSVRGETERSRDAMTGFIGGTVGELPLIGEAMGPLAEGLGQLTEGAIEGQINFKQLALAGGLMGGVAIGMQLVNKHLEKAAKIKAWRKEQVEDWSEAIYEAQDAVEGLTESYAAAGRIEVDTLIDGIKDITPTLARAGITVEDWTKAVNGGEAAMAEMDRRLKEAGVTGKAYDHVIVGLMTAQGTLAKATEKAADTTAVFGDAEEETADAVEENTDALDAQTEALEGQAEALEESIEKLEDQIESQLEAADAGYALEKAQFALTDAVEAANEVFGQAEQGSREYREAELSVIDAANNVARAEQRKAQETAAANGKTLTATQNIDIMNRSLINQASTLNGPARQALLNHIAQVNNIPANKMTQINAAIDRGDINEAERLINSTSRTRSTALQVVADTGSLWNVENQLNHLTRPRTTLVRSGMNNRAYAKGTDYHPGGTALVGEEGPEIVDLPRGSAVSTASETRNRMRGGGSGGGTTNITMNFPAGVRPDDVVKAQKRWEMRNGPR